MGRTGHGRLVHRAWGAYSAATTGSGIVASKLAPVGGKVCGPPGGVAAIADPIARTGATLHLRRELLELDVDAVEQARAGEPPPGTRAVDFIALGTLVVTVANSGLVKAAVPPCGPGLGSPQGSIKLQLAGDVLELTGVTSEEQRRLAGAWLRRHASR